MKSNKIGFGVFLISIGIIFILINAGIIDWSIWNSLYILWPLIIVVIGISIIFRQNPLVKAAAWLLFLAVIVSFSYINKDIDSKFYIKAENGRSIVIIKPAETQIGHFKLSDGGSKIKLGSTANNLVEANISDPKITYNDSYTNNNKEATIDFKWKNNKFVFPGGKKYENDFLLNRNVEWYLEFNVGATDSDIDMSDLVINTVNINSGAVNMDIKMGNLSDKINMKINSGASHISIKIPVQSGVRVIFEGALTGLDFSDMHFIKNERTYTTKDYDSAAKKIDIEIHTGVSSVDLSTY